MRRGGAPARRRSATSAARPSPRTGAGAKTSSSGPASAARTPPERASSDAAPDPFAHPSTAALVASALAEDVGRGDVTTAATIPAGARGCTVLVARDACVVAGLPLIELVLERLAVPGEPPPSVSLGAADGDRVAPGTVLAMIEGPLRTILAGERVLLNLLQNLSGVATATRAYVDAVAGTRAAIVDTRKTIPGLRLLQKYAVRVGGAHNHRFGLDDGVLIKDNHVAACGSVGAAVRRARAAVPHALRVEVECDRLAQVAEALGAGVDAILLDNMTPAEVREACRTIGGRAIVEVSGGVRLDTVRAYAEAGPDLISVGRLTHSAPAVDLALDFAGGSEAAAAGSGATRAPVPRRAGRVTPPPRRTRSR
jgi:nicotinate-nucleotide pyrophosphorylase (carboxylating)